MNKIKEPTHLTCFVYLIGVFPFNACKKLVRSVAENTSENNKGKVLRMPHYIMQIDHLTDQESHM